MHWHANQARRLIPIAIPRPVQNGSRGRAFKPPMLPTTSPRAKKTLPILNSLDDLRVAAPCDADWDGMKPVAADDGARARFCGSCEKNVYDLSAMTRSDAMALIERHEGRCCVRFYQRTDGTVLTEDCPVGVRAALKRAERRALMAAAAGVGAVAAFVAFIIGAGNPVSRGLQVVGQTITEVIPDPIPDPIPEPLERPMMGAPPPPPDVKMGEMVEPVRQPPRKIMGKMMRHPEPRVMMGDMAMPEPAVEPAVEPDAPHVEQE